MLTGCHQVARAPPAFSSEDAYNPARSRSTTVTPAAPRRARAHARLVPMTPPPTIRISARSSVTRSAAVALPECAPARPLLRQRAAPFLALRPVGRLLREWALGRFDPVPEPVHAAHEQPRSAAPLVRVAVVDRLLDPALAVLDLAAAVHAARRVLGVGEVDQVIAHEQDRDAERGQRIAPELAQRGVARAV